MAIRTDNIINQNITVVYETLDPTAVDTNKLKTLIAGPIAPTAVETPDMILIAFPLVPIAIQIADKRVIVGLQGPATANPDRLAEIAFNCQRIISSKQTKPIAYGFNYDLVVASPKGTNSVEALNILVDVNTERLNKKINGVLSYISPRLIFNRGETRYDLILEPGETQYIKAHLNVHFELSKRPFPALKALRTNFIKERESAAALVTGLVSGENS